MKYPASLTLGLLALFIWTLVVGCSLTANMYFSRQQAMERAYAEATANLNKDITFRRWATEHGGLYVPLTDKQPSVPWLAHVPGRDVVTQDGRALTLLNPASALRQMMDRYAEEYGIRGRIIGLRYLNPGNAPDDWEKTQLEAFTRGERTEVWAETNMNGKPHLRYLRAMFMEPGCVKCHAILGYQVGDMRGAIGINLPMEPYYQQVTHAHQWLWVSHGIVWLLGLTGIYFSAQLIRSHQKALEDANTALEQRVEERTAELLSAKDEAERSNAAKSEFLSRMSHELRTPLNAIIGFAQMLILPGKSITATQQADNAQEILKAGRHLLAQVNEVLDLARIDSGRIELSLAPVPLAQVLADCVAQIQPLTKERHLTLTARIDPNLGVRADHIRLKQVLLNLLSNAIKYNREHGTINVSVSPQGENLKIAVSDTGRGIAPEKLSSLFKLFERLESSYDGIEGTGIGLALVKRLVEAMNGKIGVDSQPDVGSTFWFTLPAETLPDLTRPNPLPVSETLDALQQTPEQATLTTSHSFCVLYIEDNPANLKLMKKMLATRADLHLLSAPNAEQGLQLANQNAPDLILMDINLPGMDGFAALTQLKANPATADLPVIAVTANAMKQDFERGLRAGFADYLTKPIEFGKLFATLEKHLPGHLETTHEG